MNTSPSRTFTPRAPVSYSRNVRRSLLGFCLWPMTALAMHFISGKQNGTELTFLLAASIVPALLISIPILTAKVVYSVTVDTARQLVRISYSHLSRTIREVQIPLESVQVTLRRSRTKDRRWLLRLYDGPHRVITIDDRGMRFRYSVLLEMLTLIPQLRANYLVQAKSGLSETET